MDPTAFEVTPSLLRDFVGAFEAGQILLELTFDNNAQDTLVEGRIFRSGVTHEVTLDAQRREHPEDPHVIIVVREGDRVTRTPF